MAKYQIELFYGYEDGECGIWHSFEAHDPDAHIADDEVKERLAYSLDVSSDSDYFNYDSMYIDLPESLVKKIKDDAIKEHMEGFNSEM